jgi:hypothetical protein
MHRDTIVIFSNNHRVKVAEDWRKKLFERKLITFLIKPRLPDTFGINLIQVYLSNWNGEEPPMRTIDSTYARIRFGLVADY